MDREDFKKKYSTETYLGDGLYASFDGYHVNLRTPREDGDHHIGLEPCVFDALIEYRGRIYKDAKEIKDET